ncbi:MAG: response regulator [Roseateles asaccharophilus]|uniref:LuxR family two component transcriptional regulator n=1 Tax=Roseateles asaccharophilus TaxID=582607 RepID=A0A4R6N802_9BURK|nr:response regulator [Roseateles asaccharophilus]MDN3546024.1 response regulator [Roseateles asaccharophilus]TDP11247.1 LuxR family two component transcriptional regulator [Roseateles asaccharophilus]
MSEDLKKLLPNPPVASHAERVLIVDDVPDNLALLHDALDEAGYTVLVAFNGEAALESAAQMPPDVVVLDALMPGLDGFEVARRLKADPRSAAAPIIFMTGLTDTEHVEAAFAAGGVDYVTKPIRPREVLARIAAHLRSARAQRQARNALDAFGHASLAVHEADGRCVWQTALARQLMAEYFSGGHFERGRLPPEVLVWLHREALRRRAGAEPVGLTVLPPVKPDAPVAALSSRGAKRLSFTLHAVDPDALGEGQWLIVMREADDAALMDGLVHSFKLTAREAEVLYWVVKGKTNADIGDILGSSPRTVQKHLEHVFEKLGVETRTAAAALAMSRVRGLESGR